MSNDGKMMIDDKKKNTEDGEGADAPLDIGQQDMLAGIKQLGSRHQGKYCMCFRPSPSK